MTALLLTNQSPVYLWQPGKPFNMVKFSFFLQYTKFGEVPDFWKQNWFLIYTYLYQKQKEKRENHI